LKARPHVEVLVCLQNKDRTDGLGKDARWNLYLYLQAVLYRSPEKTWIKIRETLQSLPTSSGMWIHEGLEDDFLPWVYGEILASSPDDVDSEKGAKAWVKTIANNISKDLLTRFCRPHNKAGSIDGVDDHQLPYSKSPLDILIDGEKEGEELSRIQIAKRRSNKTYTRRKALTRELLQDGLSPDALRDNLCRLRKKKSLGDITTDELKLVGKLSNNSHVNEFVDVLISQRNGRRG